MLLLFAAFAFFQSAQPSLPSVVVKPLMNFEMHDSIAIYSGTSDAEHLALLDWHTSEYSVFSVKTGSLLTVFGGKGQGPGEFTKRPCLVFNGQNAYVADRNSIHIFNSRFKYERSIKLDPIIRVSKTFHAFDNGNFLLVAQVNSTDQSNSGNPAQAAFILDPSFNIIKKVYSFFDLNYSWDSVKESWLYDYRKPKALFQTFGNLLVIGHTDSTTVELFDPVSDGLKTGKKQLKLQLVTRPMDDQGLADIVEQYNEKTVPNVTFIYPDKANTIDDFAEIVLDEKPALLVKQYQAKDKISKGFVLDKDGVVSARLSLVLGKTAYIGPAGKHSILVTENQDGDQMIQLVDFITTKDY